MLTAFEPWHLIVIGVIAVMLFGAKRLPDSARSIGQSLRIFRSEVEAAGTVPGETAAQTVNQIPVPGPHS